jgi:serine/threonine-protein kinase
VLEFGLGRLVFSHRDPETSQATKPPSPQYTSPEQIIATDPVDVRTDVWGLGAVMYEALSGIPPFQRDTPGDSVASILRDIPRSLKTRRDEISDGLNVMVLTALQKSPGDRFPTVHDFAEALLPFCRHKAAWKPAPGRSTVPPPAAPVPAQPQPPQGSGGLALPLIVLGLGVAVLLGSIAAVVLR